MNNKQYALFILALITLLLIFFFPKNAGSTCGFCPGFPSIQRTEYGCIGVKFDIKQNCMDCGIKIVCLGIVTSEKRCYTNIKETLAEVPFCKEPLSWEGILNICPDCYYQASISAYSQNDLSKAIEICNSISSMEQKDNCLLGIARLAIHKGKLTDAESICSGNLINDKDICYREIAEKIADSDIDNGVAACKKIKSVREQDNCYHNIAVKARQTSLTKALEICDMITEDISTPPCKELIEKYCEIYGC